MAIRVEHGKPETLIAAAKRAGEAQAAIRAQEQAERLQTQQMEFDYRTSLKQQDMAIDLQMNERAKLWEIDKMQLRSQMDFQREEQQRQRKLDGYDNIDTQLDKEISAGRVSEKDDGVRLLRLKNDLARQGMNVSINELRQLQEGEKTGVSPWWMAGKDAPEGSPMRQAYDTNIAQEISGERTGTIPWDMSPQYIRTAAANQSREARGIFLEPEEIEAFAKTPDTPLGDKQLDVGVRTESQTAVDAPPQDALLREFNKAAKRGDKATAKWLWDKGVGLGYWGD